MYSPSSRVTFSFVVSSRLRLRCLLVLVSPPSYALRPSGVPSVAFLHPPPHPHSHSRSVLCRHRSSPSLLFPLPPHVLPCLAVALRLQFAQSSAAPLRVAPLVASTPLVTTTPLSPHSSPPHLSSDLSSMPRLLCVVPLLSSTPLLSSMPRLLAAITSSVRTRLRPRHSHREVAPHALHVHVLFVGLTRLLCVRSENDVNVLLCVS